MVEIAIRYDEKFVKRPNTELEYTPDQISELYKCSIDIDYFLKYVKIVNPDKGEMLFDPYDYQRDLLKKFAVNRYNVVLASRQSGKTTSVAAYVLWYSIFHEDKTVGIVSNKESSAKMILGRLKRMYECLPIFLKPGVNEYSKTFITFDNHTRILISATSPDAFRGESLNLLATDEFAFVPNNIAEEFWAANYPTISASSESKIIMISTPNGLFNIFHRIYSQAEAEMNSFVVTKITWQQVPGRDEAWAKEQIANLGMVQFNQEFRCVNGNTIIKVYDVIDKKEKIMKIEELYKNL